MNIQAYASLITDHRQDINKKYSLDSLVLMLITAVLCDQCESPEDIRDFVNYNIDWFHKWTGLTKAPSRETIRSFICCLNPDEILNCFKQFIQDQDFDFDGDAIAIDGKSMRATHVNGKDALHLVSAWSSKHSITLSCLASQTKKNEVRSMERLVHLFAKKSIVFTMDAMGCTKGIAGMIREKKADYVLQLKGNQSYLKSAIEELLGNNDSNQMSHFYQKESHHGRKEIREYFHFLVPSWISKLFKWDGLHSAIYVQSTRTINGKSTISDAWYISSLQDLNAEKTSDYIRSHWQVENNLHWVLDVIFRDDQCRFDKDVGAHNISLLRRLVHNIYLKDGTKRRLKTKIAQARYDERYREKLLFRSTD